MIDETEKLTRIREKPRVRRGSDRLARGRLLVPCETTETVVGR